MRERKKVGFIKSINQDIVYLYKDNLSLEEELEYERKIVGERIAWWENYEREKIY